MYVYLRTSIVVGHAFSRAILGIYTLRIAHSYVHIIDIKNYTLNHSRPYASRGADGWKIYQLKLQ